MYIKEKLHYIERSMKFYSQEVDGYQADKFLVETYITNEIKDGKFVELGAIDGVMYSNTKTLEDYFNFTGVLIEPSPIAYERLKVNRSRSDTYNCAISSKETGTVDFLGFGAVGGMLHTMADNHRKSWQRVGQLPPDEHKYKVKCEKISTILHKSNMKYIDVFSIDVEGGEEEVLETMDWNIPVYIIIIELVDRNDMEKEKNKRCKKILKDNGFKLLKHEGLDDYWINNNYFRKHLFKN
jgi:FkbM family methyltransferase